MLKKLKWLYKRIKHVTKWLPVLWKDEDWDSHYLYIILQTKLKYMRQEFESSSIVYHKRNIHNIKITELIIDRLLKDEYAGKELQELRDKQGKMIFVTSYETSGQKLTRLEYENEKSEKEKQQNIKDMKIALHKYEYLKNYDKEYLFKHLSKHIERWWD